MEGDMASIKKVLLAEDDRFLRRACEAALRRRGVVVISAEDGEQALALARAERPNLILLDLLMPKMTGLEVLSALNADDLLRDIPVLILSNSSREFDMRDAESKGVVGYLVKANLSLQELGDRVGAILEQSA
jgi:CheY-like chemotaxis protein